MTNKQKWELLLGGKRFRGKSTASETDGRNEFENDYGRLISSAPIRRLQDKTQVFPLEQSDFIRTRLTHSLEVSYIASSIGQSIEKYLLDIQDIDESQKGNLSSLLRVAGLVHDLGNPPFGHFGEEAIKKFFKDYFEQETSTLTDLEKADFENFDGNVQTFRILSKLAYFGDEFGYNLTYSSLASIIKYPSNSIDGNKNPYTEISKKKFGYFVTETEKYKEISDYLKLRNKRSPIVYLLEAADDIAYSAADIEDGIKLGIIDITTVKEIFTKNLENNKTEVLEYLDSVIDTYKNEKYIDDSLIIQKFRIFTQRKMIESIIDCFKTNYEEIMLGEFESEIIDKSAASDIRKSYKKLQYSIFNDKTILKKEIAGWEAIYGLLKIFIKATKSINFKPTGNTYESRLFNIISSSHRKVYEDVENYNINEYKKLQLVVDFISGMTDSYAINLFQELKGIKL
ncbi:dNTP triphosphohydrolase [Chryseobacterium sp. LC2016-29]|uniref:dGTP triphosphohydrolase n=1 Tax=Chryseobacterium sp. LC2016-29 TaxID=2897331 RepID=UPI001E2E73B0|nr:dNTP triphosphohydrolase [Chryseobacterium sp. LC2016-29]MCD0479005.1 dNTP triphosphohydrolase [Chryseobacterium sp. LC2016-29]